MKRFWIGLVTLAVLLVAGWAVTQRYTGIYDPLSRQLSQASSQALAGDAAARETAGSARKTWQQQRNMAASVADHGLLEEIDALFAQLDTTRDMGDLAELCAILAARTEAISEAQKITWWNLL